MSREEIIKLLKMLNACYPNTKVNDPALTATAYEMVLGEYPAEDVYKAARLYMSSETRFFPSPGVLLKNVQKAKIIYDTPVMALEPPKDDPRLDEYLDALCKFVGLGYEEPDAHALDEFEGFMNWEI